MENEVSSFPPGAFAALSSPYCDFDKAGAVILPVPYDGTTEWHAGSRKGPQAIIEASRYLELYDLELGREIHHAGIHTLPEIEPVLSGPADMVERVYQAGRKLVQEGKFVAMLGGEHSLTLGMVRAYREEFADMSVLQLDAHADFRDEYMGTRFGQACVMRRVFEICPVTQVGIRSLSREEKEFIDGKSVNTFSLPFVLPEDEIIERVLASLGQNVYVTLDVDVFDPGIMPAVGTPEPGGMGWQTVLSVLKAVASRKRVLGFDVMEFCPEQGPPSCAFLLAKLVYKFLGYALP